MLLATTVILKMYLASTKLNIQKRYDINYLVTVGSEDINVLRIELNMRQIIIQCLLKEG